MSGVFLLFVLLLASSQPGWAQTEVPDAVLKQLPADHLLSALAALPERSGPEPTTPFAVPHTQNDQNAPESMQAALLRAMATLPHLQLWTETPYSIPPAVGWVLPDSLRNGPDNAFTAEGEFGHSHRPEDGSMHLRLPARAAQLVFEKSWGILHPFSAVVTGQKEVNYIMVYGPRDERELEAIWTILQASYAFARGLDLGAINSTAVAPATWGQAKKGH